MKNVSILLLALLPAVLAAPANGNLQGQNGQGAGTADQGGNANGNGGNQGAGTANQGAGTANQGAGTANQGAGTANQGAGTANQGAGTANQGAGTANQGGNQGAGTADQGGNNAGNNTGAANGGDLTLQPPQGQSQAGGVDNFDTAQAKVDQQTAELMQTAVEAWRVDTGRVSNFLNTGNALAGGDPNVFMNAANVAASAEVDELTHKQVLDQFMPNDANVQAANATLSNGAFQLVVDKLQNMATNGPATAQQDITDINNDRCVNVLPNIDAYMKSAALMIGDPNIVQSVRPAACGDVNAAAAAGNQNQNTQTANQLASQFQGENSGATQQDQRLPANQRAQA